MKTASVLVVAMLVASSAFAQNPRAYVQGSGGWDISSSSLGGTDLTSGYGAAQAGVRVAKHLAVFGEIGRIKNLQASDVQASVDQAVASMSSSFGLDVTGTSRIRSTYELGGVRVQGTSRNRVTPYAMGGIGSARLTPSALFTYSAGLLPNSDPSAPMPAIGTDVTSDVVTAGGFIQPQPSSAFMFALGGGAQINLAKHLMADVGYRFSRIASDNPLRNQGITLGFGVRF